MSIGLDHQDTKDTKNGETKEASNVFLAGQGPYELTPLSGMF
jgi:hypothetical protein